MDSFDYSKNYNLLLEELKADDVLLEIPQVLKDEIIEESKRLSKIVCLFLLNYIISNI